MQKIVIFTSSGGGGHLSASNALESYLKDQYEVKQLFLLSDLLKKFDPLQRLTRGMHTGEEAYNTLMHKKCWKLINLMYYLGRLYFKPFQPFMRKKIIEYLKEHNIDMIISVIPIFNNIIMQAAQELDIPFLLIPTDLDVRSFVYNLKKPYYHKFHLSLIYHDQRIKKSIKELQIPDYQISYNGFPLRGEFYASQDKQDLRSTMGIKHDLPVIMLMMGMQGAQALVSCVENLKDLQIPCHLLTCIGKNKTLEAQLKAIPLPEWIGMDIIEQTPYIANLMAISDLIITKAGSASFCEAINMELPMIIDATNSGLIWERFNHDFAHHHKFGRVMNNYNQLESHVTELFQNKACTAEMKNNIKRFHQKETPKKIRTRIEIMLNPRYQYECSSMALVKKS